MNDPQTPLPDPSQGLAKAPTGIVGFDEITYGGLPRGRPTLVCGSAGCGKTLFAMEFLLRGVLDYDEPGVFIAFEETERDLADNVRSLGFDLDRLVAENRVAVDYIHIEPSEIAETGAYDLEGLFLRLGLAIDSVGAKRVVLDTIETLFGGFSDAGLLRAELRRLFRWLKERGMTAVITAERGEGALTRQGLEEYVSDCVILLDHRVAEQVSTRRLRVVKYRGSTHGTNEYPFLIDAEGISVLPLSSLGLDHQASTERISTGVDGLDEMLGGSGYYRGSSVLITGTAGTGKTSLAALFAAETCRRGERCLYLAFEESPQQFVRNMKSIGVDLEPHRSSGLLVLEAARPTLRGLEMHLVHIHKLVEKLRPSVVIVDPVTNFERAGSDWDVQLMMLRLVDYLKGRGITALFTHLTSGSAAIEHTTLGVSSLVDTWLLLRDVEVGGERNRTLYVLKSRGMAHSNQVREYRVSDEGIRLEPVYLGANGVLTGSMRTAEEARDRATALEREQSVARARRALLLRQATIDAQIAALRGEQSAAAEELDILNEQAADRERVILGDRAAVANRRGERANGGGSDGQ